MSDSTVHPSSSKNIALGFDTVMVTLTLERIIPVKVVAKHLLTSTKYKQIRSSIQEIGIIEPLVVAPDGKSRERYILLDGHLRLAALKELGILDVSCLVSTDDEGFTYNKHVNRIAPIQEHRMILRAIERNVPQDKIAKALNLNVKSIISKQHLLDGICPEVVEMLKDRMVAVGVFPTLRRMKPYRQIEAVTLMMDAGVYSTSYARALLAATPREQMAHPEKPKNIKELSEEQMARMESEMASLQREYQLIEENYGTDVLNLTLAKGYLGSLLGNARVVRYMAQHHPAMLAEFQKVTEITSLGTGEAA
jgi:hypothetical protein